LARLLQNLVKEYDPDWQEPFVKAFGPILGPQAAKLLRSAFLHARTATDNLAQSSAEFVTEEARIIIGKAELEDFLNQVDVLRQRGDRLQARVDQLNRL
jgi:ubiquinone biosynthesis protein UbiJ